MNKIQLKARTVLRSIRSIDFTLKNFLSPSTKDEEIAVTFIRKTPDPEGKKSFQAKCIRLANVGKFRKKTVQVHELILEEVPLPFQDGRLVKCRNIDTEEVWYEFVINVKKLLPKIYPVKVEKTNKKKKRLRSTHNSVAI